MRRSDRLFVAAFFVLPFFFLCGTLTSAQSFFMRDLTYLFHPWRSLSAQMVQAGIMPLWDPYAMGGMPFLANCQSAILYPFTIPFYSLGFAAALKAFHYLHYVLAGLGFYLLGRKLGFGTWAAAAGAVVFAYNGYALTRLEFLSVLGSLVWFPWILLFALPGPSARVRAAGCALALVFSLFAGFPQILVLQLLGALLFSFFRAPRARTLLFWSSVGVLLLWIGAAQWAPTLELLGRSLRGGEGLPFSEAVSYSLPVDSLFGLIDPFRILHNPDRFTGEKFFWIWSAWWGFAATLLMSLAPASKRKRLAAFSAGLGLVGLLWAMGDQLPWFEPLYRALFLVRLFRYPPVALYWTVTAASLLVLCGAAALGDLFPRRRAAASALLLVLVAGELAYYARGFLPTVDSSYYRVTFPAVETVLKDHPQTVFLSPLANSWRRLAGMTSLEAKMRFRGSFYDLTNLPYRVRTIVPSGEPLALRSYQLLYDLLTRSATLATARPLLNFWRVSHFLTHEELDGSWKLAGTDQDLRVYRNPKALPEVFALTKEDFNRAEPERTIHPLESSIGVSKASADFRLSEEAVAVFPGPYDPGWKVFCSDGARHPSIAVRDYFYGVVLPPGTHRLRLVYDPWTWKAGLALTVCALAALAALSLRKLKCYDGDLT